MSLRLCTSALVLLSLLVGGPPGYTAAPPSDPAPPDESARNADPKKSAQSDDTAEPPAPETPAPEEAPAPAAEPEVQGPAPEAGSPGPAAGARPGQQPSAAGAVDDELARLLEEAAGAPSGAAATSATAEQHETFPWLEHHGYFRFRADLFYNGHLHKPVRNSLGQTANTSAIPAPLVANGANNNDSYEWSSEVGDTKEKVLATSNIRLRYQPTIHIMPTMRIKATFDILDNLVLGSTPDFAGNKSSDRVDTPLVAFSGAQASPNSGVVGFHDAIRVKEAYAEWQPLFLIRVGRQASNWGLGILANSGDGIDDDYGDYTDRALLLLRLFGVYIAGAWDFVYSGAITDDPGDFFGQAKDLGQADDVKQWVLSIFQRPLSAEDRELRRVDLYEHLEPVFDWGLYGVARIQEFDLAANSFSEPTYGTGWQDRGGSQAYDDLELVPRHAWAVIPDFWFRYQQRLDYESGLRIELELAAIIGEIANVYDDPARKGASRQIRQFGGALEAVYDNAEFTVGIDTGFATGDSAEGFGVEDRKTFADPQGAPNREITNFRFDRDYHVDLLLFREIIGSVTNAYYAKPYLAYDVFDSPKDSLGARLDLMVATALEPRATPGNDAFLGFEADLHLFYEEKGRFNFDIEAGFLFPGAAFDYIDASGKRTKAEFAFTVQGRTTFQF